MKTLLMMLVAGVLTAQTHLPARHAVYEVTPGTKGNELFLSVVNESKTTEMNRVTVALTNNPTGIEANNKFVEIDKLKTGEEKEVLFTFDAKRIPLTQKDTLKFIITESKGGNWKKEIVLSYTLPKEFNLEQNYPNPFNPTTTIEFTIPQKGRYNLSVYNILGQLARTLSEGEFEPGYYKTEFDARQLASGMYIYRLSGANVNLVKKMMVLK